MTKKLKIILFFFAVCLIGAGVFYFSNTWEESDTQIQTAQNLKLLNSHSHPEAGDEWTVSFETIGAAGLTITPTDPDSIGDLDFASMKCAPSVALAKEGFGQEVNPEIQNGDVLFVPDWSCDGVGIVAHLVNIARKHILKFQFSNKIAFAYNNPDSVTDTFTDESKVSATSSVVVTGGQATLATCGDNGDACAVGGECCSGYCVDDVCCNTACTGSLCQRCDGYSHNGNGTCGYVSTAEDPDGDCSAESCPIVLNSASGIDCDDKCAAETKSTGNCSSSDLSCNETACICVTSGWFETADNGAKQTYEIKIGCKTGFSGCESVMNDIIGGPCEGHPVDWTNCQCD